VREFQPSWWLPGPHLPTIWGKKFRRQPMCHDRVERVRTPDGDHVSLARMGSARAGVPHVLILHGLEGTIGATYAHGLLQRARELGWSGDLLLFRSCDGARNLAPRLYHSGETTDLDVVVRRLKTESPESPLCIVGVSLGGNVLTKWLGELGEQARQLVRASAAVSVPFDLAACARSLEHGFGRIYVRHFLATLKQKAEWKHAQFPRVFDLHAMRRAGTFWEFDDAATAPLHGFRDAAEYYARSSALPFIERVRTPHLLFMACDDPFVPSHVLLSVREKVAGNQVVRLATTPRGGHVGWVEGTVLAQKYYMEEFVMNWLVPVV